MLEVLNLTVIYGFNILNPYDMNKLKFLSKNNTRVFAMKDNYDFSQSIPNPYAKQLKKQITIGYFKNMSKEKGISYQSLINLYLKDCAETHRNLEISWL